MREGHVVQYKSDLWELFPLYAERHFIYCCFRLENIKGIHEALVEKLKIELESTLSAEERAARMDELLMEEEKRQQEISSELKQLRDEQFRKTQQLNNAQTQEINTEAEIQVSLIKRIDPHACFLHRMIFIIIIK